MALVAVGAAALLTSGGIYYYFSDDAPVETPTTTKEITELKKRNKLPNKSLLEELKEKRNNLRKVSVDKSLKDSTNKLEKLIKEIREKVKIEK